MKRQFQISKNLPIYRSQHQENLSMLVSSQKYQEWIQLIRNWSISSCWSCSRPLWIQKVVVWWKGRIWSTFSPVSARLCPPLSSLWLTTLNRKMALWDMKTSSKLLSSHRRTYRSLDQRNISASDLVRSFFLLYLFMLHNEIFQLFLNHVGSIIINKYLEESQCLRGGERSHQISHRLHREFPQLRSLQLTCSGYVSLIIKK